MLLLMNLSLSCRQSKYPYGTLHLPTYGVVCIIYISFRYLWGSVYRYTLKPRMWWGSIIVLAYRNDKGEVVQFYILLNLKYGTARNSRWCIVIMVSFYYYVTTVYCFWFLFTEKTLIIRVLAPLVICVSHNFDV